MLVLGFCDGFLGSRVIIQSDYNIFGERHTYIFLSRFILQLMLAEKKLLFKKIFFLFKKNLHLIIIFIEGITIRKITVKFFQFFSYGKILLPKKTCKRKNPNFRRGKTFGILRFGKLKKVRTERPKFLRSRSNEFFPNENRGFQRRFFCC